MRGPKRAARPRAQGALYWAESEVSDERFKQSYVIGSDPELHVERIRDVEQLGATVVCLQNGSGADPLGALRTYGEHVLPALRGARV